MLAAVGGGAPPTSTFVPLSLLLEVAGLGRTYTPCLWPPAPAQSSPSVLLQRAPAAQPAPLAHGGHAGQLWTAEDLMRLACARRP